MNNDQMWTEFEAWAKAVGFDLTQTKGDDRYWYVSTESAWEAWQAAYQAGRKAGRKELEDELERECSRWLGVPSEVSIRIEK